AEVDHELLEERRGERRRPDARQLAPQPGRVPRALDDGPPELRETLWADEREVGGRGDRPQVLGRARVLPRVASPDIGGALPDHLAEGVLALDGGRPEADEEGRVLGDEPLLV